MAVRAAIYRKKSNPLKGKVIDYKDIKTLSHYITERGKIVPSRITPLYLCAHLEEIIASFYGKQNQNPMDHTHFAILL